MKSNTLNLLLSINTLVALVSIPLKSIEVISYTMEFHHMGLHNILLVSWILVSVIIGIFAFIPVMIDESCNWFEAIVITGLRSAVRMVDVDFNDNE